MSDFALLFRRQWLQILRNPAWLLASLMTPILYLALFTPLLQPLRLPGGSALDLFLPGILAFLAYGSGAGPGFSVIFELRAGVTERLRVTPASRLAILAGPIVATMTQMLVADAILVGIGAALGYHVHGAGLVPLAALLGLLEVGTAASFVAMALLSGDINGFAAVTNGLNLPVLLLGGVLLPISLGPLWLRALAHADPLYYVVDAARALAGGSLGGAAVWQGYAVVAPLCALVLLWAVRVLKRAVA